MKKLILSLFLLLVASSYAVPNFVNSKRAEERGYKVVQDTEGTVSIQKVDDESATTISYWYGVKNPDVAELNKVLKEDATRDLQSKGSLKMGKAYVEKYTDGKNYMYTLVFKNAKPEDVLTSVAYYTKNTLICNSLFFSDNFLIFLAKRIFLVYNRYINKFNLQNKINL